MIDVIAKRYTVMNLIGQGGMADVYLAHDEILNRMVAIKVLRSKLSEDPMTLVRFIREASAASRLSHPNVVDIYDVGETDGLHYIVMEYIKGQTLKQMITRRGALDQKEALSIMLQLCSAIASAHRHQIIHRDIKPQNILVKSDGTIKITDFGIAVANGSVSLTHNNAVMGSAHYLSPESAQGKTPDEKVDIYSMGIVFYELLSGEVPFKGQTPAQIAIKHMTEPLPSLRKFNPQIPQAMENIVIRAAAKDPAERYQSAEEMYQDLKVCLDPALKNVKPLVLKTQRIDAIPGSKNSGEQEQPHLSDSRRNGRTSKKQAAPDRATRARKEQKPPKRRRAVSWGKSAAVLLVSLLLALSLTGLLMDLGIFRISGFMGYETFPNVNGLSERDAITTITSAGFDRNAIKVDESVSDSVETGHVISSNIKPGDIVKTDEEIHLQVSKGSSYLIGDYTDLYLEDVQNQFKNDGVTMDYQLTYQGAANKLPGIILEQDELQPGDRIDPDADNVIHFTVSTYPSITIPDSIIGMSTEEAKTWLNDQGIAVITSGSGSGTVVSVDPAVGSEYTQEGTDSVVTLYD